MHLMGKLSTLSRSVAGKVVFFIALWKMKPGDLARAFEAMQES